ncbi:MAG: hypothetical protein ACE5IK_04370 [Acidobacteriota bacterium]
MRQIVHHPPGRDLIRAVPVVLLVVAITCGPAAVVAAAEGGAAPEFSRKLAQFVYIEEGTDLILTVGVRVAALREAEPFFPLEVSVTNKVKKTTWSVNRESWALFDAEGRRYEMPTQSELLAHYDKRTQDTRLFESRSFTAGKHEGYRQIESSFFPDPIAGVSRVSDTVDGPEGVATRSDSLTSLDTVELRYRSFLEDVLYFPHPPGKLVGSTFSLQFSVTGLDEPARITFQIPRIVGKR